MAIVTTTVVWDPLLSTADDAVVQNKALEMFQAGQAATEKGLTTPNGGGIGYNTAPMTTVREWTSQAAAEEWVAFLAPYNPQSVVIS
jgi:hypothetical protein